MGGLTLEEWVAQNPDKCALPDLYRYSFDWSAVSPTSAITMVTENVDGIVGSLTCTAGELYKTWWDDDCWAPCCDDPVLECTIDGVEIPCGTRGVVEPGTTALFDDFVKKLGLDISPAPRFDITSARPTPWWRRTTRCSRRLRPMM